MTTTISPGDTLTVASGETRDIFAPLNLGGQANFDGQANVGDALEESGTVGAVASVRGVTPATNIVEQVAITGTVTTGTVVETLSVVEDVTVTALASTATVTPTVRLSESGTVTGTASVITSEEVAIEESGALTIAATVPPLTERSLVPAESGSVSATVTPQTVSPTVTVFVRGAVGVVSSVTASEIARAIESGVITGRSTIVPVDEAVINPIVRGDTIGVEWNEDDDIELAADDDQ